MAEASSTGVTGSMLLASALAITLPTFGCGEDEPSEPDGELLFSGQRNAHALALHDDRLCWAVSSLGSSGAIWSAPVSGGVPSQLVALNRVLHLAVRNEALYACAGGSQAESGVYRIGFGDGRVETLVPGSDCSGVALDDDAAYFSDFQGSRVESLSLVTGETTLLAENQPRPTDIVVDETHVYWINDQSDDVDGGVFRMPKLGGTRQQIVAPEAWRDPRFERQPQAVTLLLDTTDVYVIVNNQNNSDANGAVLKAAKAGGEAVILTRDSHAPLDAAMDATHVYWTRNEANRALDADGEPNVPGAVMRIAKSGGAAEVLATGQNGPQGVVLDEQYAYWVNWVSGNIRRVHK